MTKKSAIVIGSGIVGIAVARVLSLKGYQVKVFERTEKAIGASIRNFGMVWPIGQATGPLYDRAMRSRGIWKEMCQEADIWHDPVGSLHVAYLEEEAQVMQEFYDANKASRPTKLLNKEQVALLSPAVVTDGLKCGLYSEDEMIVDPREAIARFPQYLNQKWGVEFFFGKPVTHVETGAIYIGSQEKYEADIVFICSGPDCETLYPKEYAALPLTKCKLQMMRFQAQPNGWRIGPALCGGLSLIHYDSFHCAKSVPQLKAHFETELNDYLKYGVHVMVSQNGRGELTVGDSHEYGNTHSPFDRSFINEMILSYLKKFARFKDETVIETWNGIYPKLTNGEKHVFFSPEADVFVLNGLGGAGMTLSFALAEEIIWDI